MSGRREDDGGKDPWFIHLKDIAPFSFAGLWAYNTSAEVTTCTILTVAAGSPIDQVHNRMPIVFSSERYDAWLDPATAVSDVKALLSNNLGASFEFYRVGREVNSSRTENDPSLVVAV
ncbi:SOS response-associated peptidase [Roseibium album]|uniref:SOS response-associated peptidase n=1 Tax=Roseibium album TaxID=311410 RepID=UPI00391D6FCB